jgi:hypothetical protein
MRATCSTCGSPIEWARFEKSRKPVPLDVDLAPPDGNLELVERGSDGVPVVRVLTKVELEVARKRERPLLRTHFASCPDAATHRRPREVHP